MNQFKKYQNATLVTTAIMALVIFAGCAKYKPRAFTRPIGQTIEKNDIKATAQLLTESDCRYYFSRTLLKKGYQPVQIYINNNSNQDLILEASTINMPIENIYNVASSVHLDATSRVAGWAVGGLFFTPLFITAIVEALEVPKVNTKLDEDFESRCLDKNSRVSIKNNSVVNKVFFVRKENISPRLKFTLKTTKTMEPSNFNIVI